MKTASKLRGRLMGEWLATGQRRNGRRPVTRNPGAIPHRARSASG
jgi:hypothetical protein